MVLFHVDTTSSTKLLCLWLVLPAFTPCCLRSGAPAEGDEFNTVWILDSNQLGFNRAEQYHQFHNGLGKVLLVVLIDILDNTAGLQLAEQYHQFHNGLGEDLPMLRIYPSLLLALTGER